MTYKQFILLLGFWLLAGCSARVGTQQLEAAPQEAYEFQLSAGDRVRVIVFGHDDLSGEFEVDQEGQISLPLVKNVKVGGLTPQKAEEIITDRLKPDYLRDPRVSVEVLGYQPIYVLGEVERPGGFPFVSGMTVANAIAVAGGYTYRANRNKITVIRRSDATKVKRLASEDSLVYPGDIIEVGERFF